MDRESYRKITEIVKATVSPVPDENEDARYLEISVEVGTYESILNNLEEGGLMESEGDDVSVPRLRPIGLLRPRLSESY
jgi:hypothetical protein